MMPQTQMGRYENVAVVHSRPPRVANVQPRLMVLKSRRCGVNLPRWDNSVTAADVDCTHLSDENCTLVWNEMFFLAAMMTIVSIMIPDAVLVDESADQSADADRCSEDGIGSASVGPVTSFIFRILHHPSEHPEFLSCALRSRQKSKFTPSATRLLRRPVPSLALLSSNRASMKTALGRSEPMR